MAVVARPQQRKVKRFPRNILCSQKNNLFKEGADEGGGAEVGERR